MIEYRIQDGIQIFESANFKKLIIRNYTKGMKLTIDNQEELKKFLIYLKDSRTEDEILSMFNNILKAELIRVLETFKKLGVITEIERKKSRELNVLVLGLGTTGSFVVDGLCRTDLPVKLFLVDPDNVDSTNIYRQVYSDMDVGKAKVGFFEEKFINKSIKTFKIFIDNKEILEKICQEENIDLIIQCGDKPSPRALGKLVRKVSDKFNIPYITNTGYISNVVALPEFYYPNQKYNFDYKHESSNEKILLTQVLTKAKYNVAIQPSFVMIKQIEDFIAGVKPIYYNYRGFYNSENLQWEVEKIE